MAQNTIYNYEASAVAVSPLAQPKRPQRLTMPANPTRVRVDAKGYQAPAWSTQDKIFVTVVGLVVTFSMVFVMSWQNRANELNRSLATAQTQLTQITNDNNTTREGINRLTSRSHLDKMADQTGMENSQANIANINR